MASVDGSRSLQGASDEFHTNICGPCKTVDVEKGASHYCKDCSEYLCDDCKDHHRKLPLIKNHRIVSGSQVPAVTSTCRRPAIVIYCTCKKNQEVQYYCDGHQDIVCDSCKHTKHYKCKVSTLQDKSSSYTRSRIDAVMSKIETLKTDYEKMEKKRNDESKSLERSKEDCKKKIAAFRKEIDAFLDDIEKNMLKQLESLKNEEQIRINQHISTLTATLKMLESDNKLLENAKNDGRNTILLAVDVQVSKGLKEYDDRLSDIDNDHIDTGIQFQKSTKLANLQSAITTFGSLIRSSVRNIQRSRKLLLDSKIQSQILVNIKLSDDGSQPWITGSVVMPNGEIVLCDRENSKLKLLESSDVLKDSFMLNAKPWGISIVDTKTVIVTLPSKKQLQYIEVFPRLTSGRVLKLDKKCWGVHVLGNKIFTICRNSKEGEIKVLDLDGNSLQLLGINKDGSFLFTKPYHITVSTSEKIFVSDTDKETVTCMTIDQQVIYQYSDQEMNSPIGSHCDGGDNILVCGWRSNNVQMITAEGKKHCELVSSSDWLKRPYSINYRDMDNTVIVGCRDSDHVILLKLGK